MGIVTIKTPSQRLDAIEAAIRAVHPEAKFTRRSDDCDLVIAFDFTGLPNGTDCTLEVPIARCGIPDSIGSEADIGWWVARALERIKGGVETVRGMYVTTEPPPPAGQAALSFGLPA